MHHTKCPRLVERLGWDKHVDIRMINPSQQQNRRQRKHMLYVLFERKEGVLYMRRYRVLKLIKGLSNVNTTDYICLSSVNWTDIVSNKLLQIFKRCNWLQRRSGGEGSDVARAD